MPASVFFFLFFFFSKNHLKKHFIWLLCRRVARPGLCIEAHCPSHRNACEAAGRMVLAPQSFGEFDVSCGQCHCPLCAAKLTPETCGFTNCWWRFVGCKADGSILESAWEFVGNEYKRFDEVCVEG